MNSKTLRKLEYNKIISLLADHASSESGKQLCRSLLPQTELSAIEQMQEETAAAFTRIIKKGRPSFGGCVPIEASLKRLELGASLGSGELLSIGRLLDCAGQIKSYGRHETVDEFPDCLDSYFQRLEPVTRVASEIRRCILEEDVIADDASANLQKIRRSIQSFDGKIHSALNSMVNGSMRNYLQDAIVTMRGDRYCLPVKAEYRSQVKGMIHDQSSTGSTLFIEPMTVVKLNNDLMELHAKEQEEIQVILSTLSSMAAEHCEELRVDYEVLTLDSNFMAVILTLLGYSINNTIIIYDRLRENRAKYGTKLTDTQLVNLSINQTMPRSIITTATTVCAMVSVSIVCALMGTTSILTFSIPLAIGMLVGFYSSVCLAGPIWIWVQEKRSKKTA